MSETHNDPAFGLGGLRHPVPDLSKPVCKCGDTHTHLESCYWYDPPRRAPEPSAPAIADVRFRTDLQTDQEWLEKGDSATSAPADDARHCFHGPTDSCDSQCADQEYALRDRFDTPATYDEIADAYTKQVEHTNLVRHELQARIKAAESRADALARENRTLRHALTYSREAFIGLRGGLPETSPLQPLLASDLELIDRALAPAKVTP